MVFDDFLIHELNFIFFDMHIYTYLYNPLL